jgi:hypothetical protein
MKKIILALILIVLCLGCSASRKSIMNNWVGATRSHLIERWGPPNSTFNYVDDNNVRYEVLTFSKYWNDSWGGFRECKTSFYVNKNIIKRARWEGC